VFLLSPVSAPQTIGEQGELTDVILQAACGIRAGLRGGQDAVPGAVLGPCGEPVADPLPRPEAFGQVTPGVVAAKAPGDRADDQPVTGSPPAPARCPVRQQRLDQRPLIIRQSTLVTHTRLLDQAAAGHSAIGRVRVGGGYRQHLVEHAALGFDLRIAARTPGIKGFTPIPKRWAVERTYGRLILHRRLARGYGTLPEHPEAMIHFAMTDLMGRRLTGENTISWRAPAPQTKTVPHVVRRDVIAGLTGA
jgi:transposase